MKAYRGVDPLDFLAETGKGMCRISIEIALLLADPRSLIPGSQKICGQLWATSPTEFFRGDLGQVTRPGKGLHNELERSTIL